MRVSCALYALAGVPFHVDKGRTGLFTAAGLEKSLLRLEPFRHQSGFHCNLRLSFPSLVRALTVAYTYRGRDIYDTDRILLAQAFRLAACRLEWALPQHTASTPRRVQRNILQSQAGSAC
jgi:hypothetical protein